MVIQVDQLGWRLDPGILPFVPEPAGTDGDVAFGGKPLRAVTVAGGRFLVAYVAGRGRAAVHADRVISGPTGISGDAPFVAHPTDVGADVAENDGAGLQGTNHLPGLGPAVVGALVDGALLTRAAVEAVAAVGAIVPHLEDLAVVGEQFRELAAVDVEVLRGSVVGAVAVPGREVDAKLQVVAAGGNPVESQIKLFRPGSFARRSEITRIASMVCASI